MSTISKKPLTHKQRKVLRFIVERISSGHSPTIREIGAHFAIKSPNGTMSHLNYLVGKGYITMDNNRARSIHLVGAVIKVEYTADAAGDRLFSAISGGE